jgi:hypothetical protein
VPDPEGLPQDAFDTGSGETVREVGSPEVDVEVVGFEVVVRRDGFVTGAGLFVGAAVLGEAGGEVSFPGEFGGVALEPVAASGDGDLDVGDPGDGVFGVAEPLPASFELRG